MDRSREHTAAFTGHRRYDGECDDALRAVVRELYGRGFRVFWSGMALGFDLAAAEAVLALRGELPGLRRRDEFMVERSAAVVAWFDGGKGGTRYTWDYARRCKAERINLWCDGQQELF